MNLFKNPNEIAQGLGQGLFRGPNSPQEQQLADPFSDIARQSSVEEEEDGPSILADLAMAPLRGVEGVAHGLYNLADTISFDALPDWADDKRVLGRSQTMAGGFVEGLTQFLVPFFPLKAAMKVGKIGRAFAKLGTKRSDIARDVLAGSAVDFAAFDGQEERLSNLLNLSPVLKNQVTEYLAADEDDAELEGRIKNTLEGLMIEGGMRGAFGVLGAAFSGIKAVKLRQKKLAQGKTPEQAAKEAVNESGLEDVDYSEMDFVPVDETKVPEPESRAEPVTTKADDDLEANLKLEQKLKDAEADPDEPRLSSKEDGEAPDRPTTEEGVELDAQQAAARNVDPQNLEDMSYKEIQALAKELGVNAKGKRIELESRIEEHYKQSQQANIASVGEDGQLDFLGGRADGERKPIQLTEDYKATKDNQGKTQRTPTEDQGSGDQGHFKFFHDEKFLDDNADYTEGWTGKKTFTESKLTSIEKTVLQLVKQLAPTAGDRGGEQALMGSIRNVANQGGLMMVAKALAINIKNGAKETPASFEEILKEAKEIADEMGLHRTEHDHLAKIVQAERSGEGSVDALQTLRANQQALRTLNRSLGNQLRDKAAEMYELKKNGGKKGDPDYHVLETELLTILDKHRASQQIWSLYGRETSKVMLQRRALYVGSSPYNRRLGLSGQQVLNGADRMHYKKKQIGSMTTDELVDKIRAAPNGDSIFKILNKTTEATEGSKMMRMTLEYWMNSLLSSPITQMVNVLGAAGIYHMKAAEGVMGAALNGDTETMKSIAHNLYKMESIKEAWAHAVIALKSDDAVLAPDARTYDDSAERSHAISSDREDAFGGAINWLGTLVRTPSRALLAGDEFFKQLNYRFFVRSEVMADSLRKGEPMEKAIIKAEQAMEAAVTKGGTAMNERALGMEVYKQVQKQDDQRAETGQARMTPEEFDQTIREVFETQAYRVRDSRLNMENADPRYRTTDAALDYAKVATATKDIPQVQEPLARLAHWFPPAKMVFPFVRTPTNLLKMGFERTALGGVASFMREGLHGKVLEGYREIMTKGTKREQAQLKGKMATATATSAALMTYISANGAFMSGGGPRNRDEREALKLEGWQPYSIKIGDKWVSYRRLDPISTTLGILSDIAEIPKYYDVDADTAEGLFTLISVAFMNNITQQSFVQGVDDLFKVVSDPVTYGPRFLGNIAGGFVPNTLNWSQNFQEDRMLRETRSIFDHVLARVPSGAKSLPPRRNFLGEAQIINEGGTMLNAFNPLYTSSVKETPLNSEVARMLHGFSMPDSKIGGADNLDLKRMRTESGQDAYDRYLELSGTVKLGDKTLREQLSALVENPQYQMMPDDDIADETGLRNPRVRAMSRIIRHYRLSARHQLYNEMPQLRQAIASNDAQRKQYLNQ